MLAGSALVGVVAWCFFSWDFPKRLSYSYFVPLRVASIEAVTSETSLIRIHLPETLLPDTSAYPEPPDQPLQAVYVRQPELQIQRAYTPLSVDCFRDACSNVTKRGNTNHSRFIELLVKRYSDGEVSSYLHRLNTGDEVFVRGPVRTWTLPDCDELVYVSGLYLPWIGHAQQGSTLELMPTTSLFSSVCVDCRRHRYHSVDPAAIRRSDLTKEGQALIRDLQARHQSTSAIRRRGRRMPGDVRSTRSEDSGQTGRETRSAAAHTDHRLRSRRVSAPLCFIASPSPSAQRMTFAVLFSQVHCKLGRSHLPQCGEGSGRWPPCNARMDGTTRQEVVE